MPVSVCECKCLRWCARCDILCRCLRVSLCVGVPGGVCVSVFGVRVSVSVCVCVCVCVRV